MVASMIASSRLGSRGRPRGRSSATASVISTQGPYHETEQVRIVMVEGPVTEEGTRRRAERQPARGRGLNPDGHGCGGPSLVHNRSSGGLQPGALASVGHFM